MNAAAPAPVLEQAGFRLPPELARFTDEPPQMPSGAVGKSGSLRLEFERRGERTVLAGLEARVPFLAQRALHFDEAMPQLACVFLITTTGCVLQGDRLALDVRLGRGASAHLTTQSATKIHAMEANCALQTQDIVLDEDSYLEVMPEPLIPHRCARFASDTRITMAASASLILAEIVQPGRRHHREDDRFGFTVMSLATRAQRPNGRLLFAERLLIEPGSDDLRRAGVMGEHDVLGNVFVCTPTATAERIYRRIGADVATPEGLAHGACRLPNDAGLVYKVIARETAVVKERVRELWRVAREEITGAGPSARFFWR